MVKIKYIARYFALMYPYKDELSKARLTKMVYLADWCSAQKRGNQLTNIRWYFDHYGPYVSDVFKEVAEDKKLEIKDGYTAFGTPKQTVCLRIDNPSKLKLNLKRDSEKKVLDRMIIENKHLKWTEFINYVYNTYPIKSQKRYNFLDMDKLAIEEKQNSF